MLGNMPTGKIVMRAAKGVVKAVTGYNEIDHRAKKFGSVQFSKQYQRYKVFQLRT